MINQHQASFTMIYTSNLHIIGAYLHIIGAYPHNIPIIVSEIYPIVYPSYFLFFKKATRNMITIQISCITDFPICWTVSTPSPLLIHDKPPLKSQLFIVESPFCLNHPCFILKSPFFHPQITISYIYIYIYIYIYHEKNHYKAMNISHKPIIFHHFSWEIHGNSHHFDWAGHFLATVGPRA